MSVLNLNSISVTPNVLKEIGFSTNPKSYVFWIVYYPHRARLLINKRNLNKIKCYTEYYSGWCRGFMHQYTTTYEVSEKIDILLIIEMIKTKFEAKHRE